MNNILFKILMLKGDAGEPTDEQTQSAVDDYMQAHPEAAIDETIINSAVGDWLADHPEATTTVQDGSLTEAKFSNALKLKSIKDYVTPEMFGAAGDGETDDTTAIQNAINSGEAVFMFNTYFTSQPITISNAIVVCCYGEILYSGVDSAIILTTSDCNVYFRKITSDGNGVELRPSGIDTTKKYNCSNNIVSCDDILCQGENGGIGLYLNATDGLIQFCKFNINSIRGSYGSNIIDCIKIKATNASTKYCNGNVFNVHSLSYANNALTSSCVASSCFDNVFNDVHFEHNTNAINVTYMAFKMNARFDAPTHGKIKLNDNVSATIYLDGGLEEYRAFDLDPEINSGFYHFIGAIKDTDGNTICRELYITSWGIYAPNTTEPLRKTPSSLTKLYGDTKIGYVVPNGTLHFPAVRPSGYINPMQSFKYRYAAAELGSETIEFSDGTTQQITWTKYGGVILVFPKADGSGQTVVVL